MVRSLSCQQIMFYDIWVEFLASCSAKTDFHEKWHFVLSESAEMDTPYNSNLDFGVSRVSHEENI